MAKGTSADGGVQDIKASGKGGGGGDVPAAAGEAERLVIRAPVHCDGCGRKLRRSLQRIEGIGEVSVDSRTNTVVVRGRRAVENATEVVQVVEKRTGEKAALVSPSPEKLPPPRSSAPNKPKGGGETNKKDDGANTKDTANELPDEVDMEMVTVLKINLHCDACSEEMKRRILKISGVEEAVPHLKSSQMMVKGKVEPATLVGFIHKCTGRKAAIIRAEPLEDLLPPQSPNSPAPPMVMVAPPPPVQAASKKDETPAGEKKNGGGQNGKKKEEPNNKDNNKGGGGGEEDDNVGDEDPKTEKPPSDGGGHGGATAEEHGATHAGGAPDHKNNGGHGDDGLVLENRTKDDRLFTVPMPAGVVTAVAPEMALGNRGYCYPAYPSYAQYYYHPDQQYQYQYPQAYACSPAAAMYGYGYPANYPPEAFSEEENPNACTIV